MTIIENRLKKLRQRLVEREIEAILITGPENRYYLSGFDGSDGWLLVTPQESILATDFRYIEQAKRQAPGYSIYQISGDMESWFAELTGRLNLKQLAFEAEHVTLADYQRLSSIVDGAGFKFSLTPLEGLVESLRILKEPPEIELITRAVRISDAAFEYIHHEITQADGAA